MERHCARDPERDRPKHSPLLEVAGRGPVDLRGKYLDGGLRDGRREAHRKPDQDENCGRLGSCQNDTHLSCEGNETKAHPHEKDDEPKSGDENPLDYRQESVTRHVSEEEQEHDHEDRRKRAERLAGFAKAAEKELSKIFQVECLLGEEAHQGKDDDGAERGQAD